MTLVLPDMNPCFFCEVIAERESWNIVERSELTVTLLNGRQYETGQCMVVPRRHAPTLLDLNESEDAAIMAAARRAARALVDLYSVQGVLLYQNNGVASGQEVPHFHLHVVPRQPNSDWGLGPPHIARFGDAGKPPRLDHNIITDLKLSTAERLRQQFQRMPP